MLFAANRLRTFPSEVATFAKQLRHGTMVDVARIGPELALMSGTRKKLPTAGSMYYCQLHGFEHGLKLAECKNITKSDGGAFCTRKRITVSNVTPVPPAPATPCLEGLFEDGWGPIGKIIEDTYWLYCPGGQLEISIE